MSSSDREEIVSRIRQVLEGHEEVVFAYLYGSSLDAPFRDIDVAVYVDRDGDPLGLALHLSVEIERASACRST